MLKEEVFAWIIFFRCYNPSSQVKLLLQRVVKSYGSPRLCIIGHRHVWPIVQAEKLVRSGDLKGALAVQLQINEVSLFTL